MQDPSFLEITWTAASILLFALSMWQVDVALHDWRRKKAELAVDYAAETYAASKLAFYLFITVVLDTTVLLFWLLAGALSIFRHYWEAIAGVESWLGLLLFAALIPFAGRVMIRAYSRQVVNKLAPDEARISQEQVDEIQHSVEESNELIRAAAGLQSAELTDREEGHEHRTDIVGQLRQDKVERADERQADRAERKEERRLDREERAAENF